MSLLATLGLASMAFTAWFTWRACSGSHDGAARSKREAIIEAWINIIIGFSLNWAMNWMLLPMVGASFTWLENFLLGWIYTAVSLMRGYLIRRWAEVNIRSFAQWIAATR